MPKNNEKKKQEGREVEKGRGERLRKETHVQVNFRDSLLA